MTDEELKRILDALDERNRLARAEDREHFDASTARIEQKFETTTAEIRRHFDATTEALKHEIQLVSEATLHLDAKLDRRVDALEEKVDRGFADTHAMIRFSHAELERRVRTLEQG